jgi:hypothetical protein
MIGKTYTAAEFLLSGYAEYVRDQLTRGGSDFQVKLSRWLAGEQPTRADGHIALVTDHGEAVGWARTEYWPAEDDGAGGYLAYDTLEAFVSPTHRLRGIAAFAACGLYAGALHDNCGTVAVFSPAMILVARRAGLWSRLFQKDAEGKWVAA